MEDQVKYNELLVKYQALVQVLEMAKEEKKELEEEHRFFTKRMEKVQECNILEGFRPCDGCYIEHCNKEYGFEFFGCACNCGKLVFCGECKCRMLERDFADIPKLDKNVTISFKITEEEEDEVEDPVIKCPDCPN